MWPQIIFWFLVYQLWKWYKNRNVVAPQGPQFAEMQTAYERNLTALHRFAHLGYCTSQGGPGCLADPPHGLIRVGMLFTPWTREQTCLFAQGMILVPYPIECISAQHLWVGQLPWSRIRILPAQRSPTPTPPPPSPPPAVDPLTIIVRLDENMCIRSMSVSE